MNIPVTQIVEEITEVNVPVPQNVEEIAEVSKSSSEWWSIPNLYFEINKIVSWMSLCETGQLIRFLCRMSDVLVKSTDRCTCTLCFQFLLVVHSCSDFS